MVNNDSRTVDISFSSETRVQRYDWWTDGYYNEVLGHDIGNADLTRLSQMGVLLFNHKSDVPIGEVINPQLDAAGRKCTCQVRFDTDADSEKIYQKVLSGTLKGVSVGYRVTTWETVKAGGVSTCGRFQGPCEIARKWEPYEVSIVSIPADIAVGVGRNMPDENIKDFIKQMTKEVVREYVSTNHTKPQEPEGDLKNNDDLDSYKRRLKIHEKTTQSGGK